ncbi:MAG: THUMP domain-containing protein [Thermoproteota archaeon]|nr:THUMP domain-containing protein [Thermoproteota archaeon]
MPRKICDFNLLVSHPWGDYQGAKREARDILGRFGDEDARVERTVARGVIGVKTCLDEREVIGQLRRLFLEEPLIFQCTLKWVPVDLWTLSDIDSMKGGVRKLRDKIQRGERWRMTVEKRRYTKHHKIEIIRELAELVDEKVDLTNPDKILRVEIIGKYTALSVLKPQNIFSVAKPLFS